MLKSEKGILGVQPVHRRSVCCTVLPGQQGYPLWNKLICFKFYGCISQQQNVMQDFVRTATYHRAILQNHIDFRDK
ncbi:hypothetical protein H8959_012620, partial [Pygathrix nigripes]